MKEKTVAAIYMESLIAAARSGSEFALDRLSKMAFGGDPASQAAIHEMEENPPVRAKTAPRRRALVWPDEVESGERGPMLGDVPQHNDV